MKITIKIAFTLCISLFANNVFAAKIEACNTPECVDYFKKYKKFARAGYADAMATLAELYTYGYGTERNTKKALKQYRKAAKYGSVKGQFKAGMILISDEKYKDIDAGARYLKKAARNKDNNAALILAMVYSSKNKLDFSESDKWLTQAYSKGHVNAVGFVESLKSTNKFTASNYPNVWEIVENNPQPITPQTKGLQSTAKTEQKVAQTVDKTSQSKANREQKIVKTHNSYKAPTDNSNIEVIEVTLSLHEMFDSQLASLRNTYPDKGNVATGSNIIGKPCEQTISCGGLATPRFNRYVAGVMGDWAVDNFRDMPARIMKPGRTCLNLC